MYRAVPHTFQLF